MPANSREISLAVKREGFVCIAKTSNGNQQWQCLVKKVDGSDAVCDARGFKMPGFLSHARKQHPNEKRLMDLVMSVQTKRQRTMETWTSGQMEDQSITVEELKEKGKAWLASESSESGLETSAFRDFIKSAVLFARTHNPAGSAAAALVTTTTTSPVTENNNNNNNNYQPDFEPIPGPPPSPPP
jgi:hypothetical protein